ncbi:relaxase/mobilization nuclease domain-containing protein [Pseudonocardia nigra]|uniref:relaxase/mobilization nuclease domain-containing protein n=1 Tax=Pseudonocardia nigra TaxID=1921578 RepID=UPI001C5D4D23|nr:relaxase/mobilization nuclease domain-containing protein [Pseudonocardia nigra]
MVHGWRPGGLIAYLMGPGRGEEHRQPRIIATWDGLDVGWQPRATGPGEWDLELGPLIRALRAPAIAAGLPEEADATGKRGYVWHCSARVAAGDRMLSDGEWAEIARELLHGAGVARRGDAGGPRWVAVRHAEDHIHIAVVLVRQDTGRRFWPHRDYPKLRETARAIERRLGLTLTAAADGTAARAPVRGEIDKAARQGRLPARVELVRAVKAAAVASHDVASFGEALREAGYLVEIRHAPSGDPLGYKVARPGDRTAAGYPIFYSGSKLAPDLSLPKLRRRWAADPGDEAEVADVLSAARHRVDRARRSIAAGRAGDGRDGIEDVVHATGDVVTAVRGLSLNGRDLGQAADLFDRAARTSRGVASPPSAAGGELRRVARRLIRHRRLATGDEVAGGVALAVALAALMQEIAAWQRERGRVHQAAAAEAAAGVVAAWSAAWPPVAPDRVVARHLVEVADHGRGRAEPRVRPPQPRPSREAGD